MSTRRLIEEWLPIAEIGEESVRERRSMTALPPTYYLHVWWARRPLVASRAAILASLIPADSDRAQFMRVLGIHGDPVEAKRLMELARRANTRIPDPYGYKRAFSYLPSAKETDWIRSAVGARRSDSVTVLDPTAGGGSIPFESVRLGLGTLANDLNPVAALIERGSVEWPLKFGLEVHSSFVSLSGKWRARMNARLEAFYPQEQAPDAVDTTYLWARTVVCPYCGGLIPLSPNWRLAPNGTGVRLRPMLAEGPGSSGRICEFEVVPSPREHSDGTVAEGYATCPFPDCARVVDGAEVKRQAQSGKLGDQLYSIVFRQRIAIKSKKGNLRYKWKRAYRCPGLDDDVRIAVSRAISARESDWLTADMVPNDRIPQGSKTDELIRYGMTHWYDVFSTRQLLGHVTAVEVYHELLGDCLGVDALTDVDRAAFGYLALSLDKLRDYNSRMTRWHSKRQVMVNTFDRHDFALKWSYAEMSPLIEGLGYDWAIAQTGKCIRELVGLVRPDIGVAQKTKGAQHESLFETVEFIPPPISISSRPADSLSHVVSETVDAVIIDPPYYGNVMYAELSDFFYVWLKRTAGHVFPGLFTRTLTDKQNEAVANPAKFRGELGAGELAKHDYRDRMAAIFAECRRVLKPDGIMTLMFTHKATGAWDALTSGLMEAGFTISASWPINTEAEGSLHIKNKSAANSTIFLACRPRPRVDLTETHYWEDVEPRVAKAVRRRVEEFQKAGIGGVDLYLASFGPALEEFSKHWPLKRGTLAPAPQSRRKRKQKELFVEKWDPYAVSPEDALNAARREVKSWRLEQLTHMKTRVELDPVTSFFVLAWDAFHAPVFPYDEALRLARAVGVDLDKDIIGKLAEKKAKHVRIWDSSTRAAKHALGSPDGSRSWIDAIHHAAHMARLRSLDAAKEMIEKAGIASEPQFIASFEAVLEVLPVGRIFGGDDLEGDLAASGSDFEVLEKLRRLAFASKMETPRQLDIFGAASQRGSGATK